MKILMINKFLYPAGGTETYMFGLGRELCRLGHQVEYFGMAHENNCVGNRTASYTTKMDFHTANPLQKIRYSLKTIYSPEARKKLRIVLTDFQPDAVHLNNFNYQLTPSVLLEIRKWDKEQKRKTKIVYTAHDYQLLCPNHMLNIPSTSENCEACLNGSFKACIQNSCIHNSKSKSAFGAAEAALYRRLGTYKEIDKIICCSHFMESKIRQHPHLKGRTVTLHNFCQAEPVFAEKKNYVLYFGRYAKEKGLLTLLACAKALPEIPFVFAGSGELEPQISQIPNIQNVGFKTGEELHRLIAEAAFSVYPSIWYENCPYSVMESIRMGTPVVASCIGGLPELIEEDSTGVLVAPKNVQALRDAIKSLYENKKRRLEMAENCRHAHFDSVQDYTNKLIKIYNE